MSSPSDRLRLARERAGFESAEQAARRFRWHAHSYRDREAGRRGITVEHAEKYGAAFNISPWWILTGKRDIRPIPGFDDIDYVYDLFNLFDAIRVKSQKSDLSVTEEEALRGALWALAFDDETPDDEKAQEALYHVLDRVRRTARAS